MDSIHSLITDYTIAFMILTFKEEKEEKKEDKKEGKEKINSKKKIPTGALTRSMSKKKEYHDTP